MWKAIWEYLTYERYGRRALRPGARIALGAAVAALAVILLGTAWSWRTARTGARPAPTLPPPTATAVFAAVTATARAPTPTPAPACPEDPRAWALVPLQAGLRDPKTGKPIQLPKPPQRIDPPCVYEGLARDLARSLVPNPDLPEPSARGKTLSVPWFWAPGMEAPTIRVIVESADYFEAGYDTGGKRIETRYVPYTAVATGDPDYPVLAYVYQDDPGVAWVMGRPVNREESFQWLRIRLEGGEVQRVVLPVVYEAKTRRWIWIGYLSRLPPRHTHAVPAGSAEDVAALFGLPLWRRGELLARFGLKDIFPESVNPGEAKPIGTLIVRPDGAEARR
jgi:hypothetical protein